MRARGLIWKVVTAREELHADFTQEAPCNEEEASKRPRDRVSVDSTDLLEYLNGEEDTDFTMERGWVAGL